MYVSSSHASITVSAVASCGPVSSNVSGSESGPVSSNEEGDHPPGPIEDACPHPPGVLFWHALVHESLLFSFPSSHCSLSWFTIPSPQVGSSSPTHSHASLQLSDPYPYPYPYPPSSHSSHSSTTPSPQYESSGHSTAYSWITVTETSPLLSSYVESQ